MKRIFLCKCKDISIENTIKWLQKDVEIINKHSLVWWTWTCSQIKGENLFTKGSFSEWERQQHPRFLEKFPTLYAHVWPYKWLIMNHSFFTTNLCPHCIILFSFKIHFLYFFSQIVINTPMIEIKVDDKNDLFLGVFCLFVFQI